MSSAHRRNRSASQLVLRRGDTIVVDEAGTMTTQDYHRLLTVCRQEGYRLGSSATPNSSRQSGAGA
jgi:superfamily II DNA or RNA helicase